jgi:hypothetical protein
MGILSPDQNRHVLWHLAFFASEIVGVRGRTQKMSKNGHFCVFRGTRFLSLPFHAMVPVEKPSGTDNPLVPNSRRAISTMLCIDWKSPWKTVIFEPQTRHRLHHNFFLILSKKMNFFELQPFCWKSLQWLSESSNLSLIGTFHILLVAIHSRRADDNHQFSGPNPPPNIPIY